MEEAEGKERRAGDGSKRRRKREKRMWDEAKEEGRESRKRGEGGERREEEVERSEWGTGANAEDGERRGVGGKRKEKGGERGTGTNEERGERRGRHKTSPLTKKLLRSRKRDQLSCITLPGPIISERKQLMARLTFST